MEIARRQALVTGGGSGLGLATATALAARGANVVVLDLPSLSAEATTRAFGGTFIPGDVTSEADVGRAIDAAGELRICVNCAGIGPSARIAGRNGPHPLELFRQVVDVNLVGTFNVLRLAAQAMSELPDDQGERGVVVNTSSIAAFEGQVGQAAYAASKGGVAALTICAARDLASVRVRVCTIAPGSFDTPLLKGLPAQVRESLTQSIPHPARLGAPAEFAQLALAIIENPYLNGDTIRLDGAARLAAR